MPNDRSLLEREMERVELRPFTVDAFHRERERKQRNRQIRAGVLALVVAAIGAAAFVRALSSETVPAGDPRHPFLGLWVSASDADGGTRTMDIRVSEDALTIEVHDDIATACSDTPSTMAGAGRLRGPDELVIPSPNYTCDDGSEPQVESGPPLQEQLRGLTFVLYDETGTLTDTLGGVWHREGEDPPPPPDTTSGAMWPQSSLKEVRQAQERADAGDPDYTWQVDPEMAALDQSPAQAEIFARFLREELGWEAFAFGVLGHGEGVWGGYNDVVFVRCAPDGPDPFYPNDPEACAPTLDGFRHEKVLVDAAQLDRGGPAGIWVVTGWQTLPPFEQLPPPSDAEMTDLVNRFLEARLAGEGAEEYLTDSEEDIPLLYETSGGAPYTRAEFERVRGPEWPYGYTEFEVRLFAEGEGTVVEQRFGIDPCPLVFASSRGCEAVFDRLAVDFTDAPFDGIPATTENGQTVPDRFSMVHGEVTFAATDPPWLFADYEVSGPTVSTLDYNLGGGSGGMRVVVDPLPIGTGCEADPAPADAAELAERILSDPDVDATEPLPVRIAEIEALQMDVAPARGASICVDSNEVGLFTTHASPSVRHYTDISLWVQDRYRVYVLDVPAGSTRVLAIVVYGDDRSFETMVDAAAPVLDSLEFHTR